MNLARLAEESVERFGEYEELLFDGRWHRNTETMAEGRRFANALVSLGVRPGDRVAVMLPNCMEVFQAYGGTIAMGGVVVPILFLLAPDEIRHILADCRPRVLVTGPLFLDKAREAVGGLDSPPRLVVVGEPVPEDALAFAALTAGAGTAFTLVERGDDDVAVIMYTGGTTGRPKGVMLTHGNLSWNARTLAELLRLEQRSMSLLCLPVTHLFGMFALAVAQLSGLRGVMLEWFTPEDTLRALEEHGVTYTAMVPTMLTMLLHHPDAERYDTSSLRTVFVSAAPVPVELAEGFEKKFGCEVVEAYGQTEAAPTIALTPPGMPKKAGSTGPPIPGVELAILDDEDRPLPDGQVGEVCARGPGIMKGYHDLPDLTAETLRGGWLHTGDLGSVDEEGYLYVTDRKKDMIIRGGFNVYPSEVEEVLLRHPGVAEVAVVGRPDERLGEEVAAFVVKAPGEDPAADELLTFAAEHLARYKAPREVLVVGLLPRSPIGKVLKRELREGLERGAP